MDDGPAADSDDDGSRNAGEQATSTDPYLRDSHRDGIQHGAPDRLPRVG